MQLVYIDKTFLKIEGTLESLKTSKIALRALFYDEQKKSWGNPFVMNDRSKLDHVMNLNEFNERKWILLKKNTSNVTSEKYQQDGPYSSREIFELLSQSKVRLKDPIWTEGMTEWQLIKNVQSFRVLENFSKPFETDVAEILSHVMEYDPQMRRVEDKNSSPGTPDEVFIILDDK